MNEVTSQLKVGEVMHASMFKVFECLKCLFVSWIQDFFELECNKLLNQIIDWFD